MQTEELLTIKPEEPDQGIYGAVSAYWDTFAKPIDGLGTFEDMICKIASIQRTDKPDISRKALVIMIADTGVTQEGVTQTGSSVTCSVAKLMGEGRSTVGVMTKGSGIKVIPVDVGMDTDEKIPGVIERKVARGSGNITKEAAMTDDQCLAAIETGIDIVRTCCDEGIGIIATGEMGIGNTTTSTALYCAITGENPKEVTGRGAGLSDEGLARKIDAINRALKYHGLSSAPEVILPSDALRMLSLLGGYDLAGLTGVFIGGAIYRIPVIIDGFISAVAALTASNIVPVCKKYMLASHVGKEKGCEGVLDRLGLKAVIDASMALGEGSGAVMLFPLLDMVMNCYNNGTRFSDTAIEQYERFSK